jgi:hypothetical protein
MSTRKAGPVASRTGLFERTARNTAIQEAVQETSKPRIKRTFNIPDDVVLLLNEIQLQRYRQTGKKPELSELVTEGIRLLADQDQQALAS